MKVKSVLLPLAVCTAAVSYADEVQTVSDSQKVWVQRGVSLCVATVRESGFPEVSAKAIFHFDAADTNGWEFAGNGSDIVRIPSLLGDGRYLSPTKEQGAAQWAAASFDAPSYVAGDEGFAHPYVDFGAYASGKGLLFDGGDWRPNRFGTIIMVQGSQEGGGYLVGANSYAWYRGNPGGASYWSPVVTSSAHTPVWQGAVYEDLMPNLPYAIGFNHGWDIVSFVTKSLDDNVLMSGLGFGTGSGSAGGMRIAEFYAFDGILTQTEISSVVRFLRSKWLDRPTRGYNGNGRIDSLRVHQNTIHGTGIEQRLDVPEGESVVVGRLTGGRQYGASFVKTGEGELEVQDARGYAAPIRLQGGTLKVEKRAVPESLPDGICVRLDASAPNAVETVSEGGTNFVTCWHMTSSFSPSAGATAGDAITAALPLSDSRRPWLVRDALGPGLHAVDFGKFVASGKTGNVLYLARNAEDTGVRSIDSMGTIVAVVAPLNNGGGEIVGSAGGNNSFLRTAGAYTVPIAPRQKINNIDNVYATPEIYINGVRRPSDSGYGTPGYQVLALQVAANGFSYICGLQSGATAAGGYAIAELVAYNRRLTERELYDASAVLMKKWFNRPAPGYCLAADDGVADYEQLTVDASSRIHVGAKGARINTLTLNAPLVKAGPGRLEVMKIVTTGKGRLVIEEGSVWTVRSPDPGSEKAALAVSPSLHLDASAANTICYQPGDGLLATNYLTVWSDVNGRNAAYNLGRGASPWLNTVDTLGGKPVVDFGVGKKSTGRCMYLAEPLDSVRSVYVILGSQNGGGSLLGVYGSENTSNLLDFTRAGSGSDSCAGTALFYTSGDYTQLRNSEVYANGVAKSYAYALNGGYELIEVHLPAGAHASALACTCDAYMRGGQRLGEVVIYERELTARERVATRNYLMKKWFLTPDEELAPLPDAPDTPVGEYVPDPLVIDGDYTLDVEQPMGRSQLMGAGTFTKTGSSSFTLREFTAFTGTVSVAEGTLKLTSAPYPVRPALVTDHRLVHMDAQASETLEVNDTGNLVCWQSVLGDGWKVYPVGSACPFVADDVNGLPAIRIPNGGTLRFSDPQGTGYGVAPDYTSFLTNIWSVLWVIGSQEGGGFLLGGGSPTHKYDFGRGPGAGTGSDNGARAADELVGGAAHAAVQSADWRVNGKTANPRKDGLSGGWDVVSMALKPDATSTPTAQGYAFDGRWTTGYTGHQRLAEVIIYDRVLTPEEIAASEEYLKNKWGFVSYVSDLVNEVDLDVLPGAYLDCNGTTQYVASVSGGGTVKNGMIKTARLRIVFDDDGTVRTLAVDGEFVATEGFAVELVNAPSASALCGGDFLAVSADAIGGADFVRAAPVTGVPGDLKARMRVRSDGRIVLSFARGLLLLVR